MKVVLICFQFSLLVGSLHGFAPPVTRLACTKCHWAVAGPAKEEKLTSEAVELLNALAARREAANQDETETPLLVAQVAPAVRVAIAEEFGVPIAELPPGKLVAAIRQLGFDLVLDVNTAADLTICEEGTELLNRLKAEVDSGKTSEMPLFTSCCTGWMTFVEKSKAEDVVENISTTTLSSFHGHHFVFRQQGGLVAEHVIEREKGREQRHVVHPEL